MSLSKNEIKFIRSLQQKKFRDLEGLFVVEGVKVVQELIDQDNFAIKEVYTTDPESLNYNGETAIHEISKSELERISGFKNPNKIVAVAEKREPTKIDTTEENLILLLDDIKDPGNLGTIIRTADWFGVTQIICSPTTVDMFNPKVIQASMGAIFRTKIVYQNLSDTIPVLAGADFQILGADMDGENAFGFSFFRKTALIMGSESHGLSEDLKEKVNLISIPRKGMSESLNVGMAAGILMAQYVNN